MRVKGHCAATDFNASHLAAGHSRASPSSGPRQEARTLGSPLGAPQVRQLPGPRLRDFSDREIASGRAPRRLGGRNFAIRSRWFTAEPLAVSQAGGSPGCVFAPQYLRNSCPNAECETFVEVGASLSRSRSHDRNRRRALRSLRDSAMGPSYRASPAASSESAEVKGEWWQGLFGQ